MRPSSLPPAPLAARVFAAFLVARGTFGLVYLGSAIGHVPILWYHPLTHAWELTSRPQPYAMGWFGLTAIAAFAAAVTGALTYAVGGRPAIARGLSRPAVVLSIARAGGLILVIDFVYFGWALMRDERTPWPEPACAASASSSPSASPAPK